MTAHNAPKKKTTRFVELMDTTLRDGEQTQGVAISADEKLSIARALLERANVDRIEAASACVSKGELAAVKAITAWAKKAKMLHRIEALGFCDGHKSVDWLLEANVKTMNLLTKGSYRHVTEQLKKTPAEHVSDIAKTVEYARKHGIQVNCYPEDWSSGMLEKNEYARWLIARLAELPVKRVMLADTLGIFDPDQTKRFVSEMVAAHPNTHFDFHGHNDYGLATANALAAAKAGARGVHATVNGLGERAGNAPLDEVAVALRDMAGSELSLLEAELFSVSKMVEIFSGRRLAPNKPISGSAVFTQTAGIHADGDKKGNLYVGKLSAERFKRNRAYALGKLSGKANIDMNLERLGIELTAEQKKLVLDRVVELGDKKQTITPDDLPFIISNVLQTPDMKVIDIADCVITSSNHLPPMATIRVILNAKEHIATASGDGGYDAFMKALHTILDAERIAMPKLLDYVVHIPPGGKTDALVETTITWEGGFYTRGVDGDQVRAAIIATENMLNLYLRRAETKTQRGR